MIYEYECKNGHRQTLRRHIAERDQPTECPDCGLEARRIISAPSLIFNSDSFPSHALKGDTFWRKDGRNMYFKENEFLQREAADDAAAAPNTCRKVAETGGSKQLVESVLGGQ